MNNSNSRLLKLMLVLILHCTSTCHRKTQSSVELTLSSFGSNKLLIPYIFNNVKQTIN